MADKANPRRKNRDRKPYTKSKVFDSSCRNHGSCKYCENNRTHKVRKQKLNTEDQ